MVLLEQVLAALPAADGRHVLVRIEGAFLLEEFRQFGVHGSVVADSRLEQRRSETIHDRFIKLDRLHEVPPAIFIIKRMAYQVYGVPQA